MRIPDGDRFNGLAIGRIVYRYGLLMTKTNWLVSYNSYGIRLQQRISALVEKIFSLFREIEESGIHL